MARATEVRPKSAATPTRRRPGGATDTAAPLLVVSAGCPAGIGPEVAVRAAARQRGARCLLVGDVGTMLEAADLVGVSRERFSLASDEGVFRGRLGLLQAGAVLKPRDRRAGHPSSGAGAAQLAAIELGYRLAVRHRSPLVTGPVSKHAIATCGLSRARAFRGHTEWLEALDGAKSTTMCFVGGGLATSLVTTHLPLAGVPGAITAEGVCRATLDLVDLLRLLGTSRPRIAVASLNPHAGEGELLGSEERLAVVPGLTAARRRAARRAVITGPLGAETAYRRHRAGQYDGVVAQYHDQATIPMKLLAFGRAVNVTMGLSVARTSVDHGTAYDVAWQGLADASGMSQALRLGSVLARAWRVGGRGESTTRSVPTPSTHRVRSRVTAR